MTSVPSQKGKDAKDAKDADGQTTAGKGAKTPRRPVAAGFVPTALTAAYDNPQISSVIKHFVLETMQKSIPGIRKEFAALRAIQDGQARVPIDSSTAGKFRYKDVHCLEKSRVTLTFLPQHGDFVHANWVKSDVINNAFICCQGPLDATAADFWRMIWQERVQHIFMLCRCEELGKAKCAQYWPLRPGDGMTFHGVLSVKTESVAEDPDITATTMIITHNGDARRVEHRAWKTWPDKSVPRNPVPAFKLLHIARTTRLPVVVHCSAGIGRTGTLVALELLQRTLMHAMEPSMMKIVSEIRSQRTQAVQTEDQYVFIHYVLLGKLAFHGLMDHNDFRTFHNEYEAYIKAMGGQPPVQPVLPGTPEHTAATKRRAQRANRRRTVRQRNREASNETASNSASTSTTTPSIAAPSTTEASSSEVTVNKAVGVGSRKKIPKVTCRRQQTKKGVAVANAGNLPPGSGEIFGSPAGSLPSTPPKDARDLTDRAASSPGQPRPLVMSGVGVDGDLDESKLPHDEHCCGTHQGSDREVRKEDKSKDAESGRQKKERKGSAEGIPVSVFLQPNMARDESKEQYAGGGGCKDPVVGGALPREQYASGCLAKEQYVGGKQGHMMSPSAPTKKEDASCYFAGPVAYRPSTNNNNHGSGYPLDNEDYYFGK